MKKSTKSIFAIVALASLLTIVSCKKNDTGGKAEIHAHIGHHNTEISSSIVYIKFNSRSAPSDPTTNYDLKVEGEATDNHVHIDELRPGNYYLYAVGFDKTINKTVKGGTAVEIKWKDRKKTIEAEIEVTE